MSRKAVQEWNAEHPIGTQVRYWPGTRQGPGHVGVTVTKAFILNGHTPVVMIDTARSVISLTHVEAIEADTHPATDSTARCLCGSRDVATYADGGHYCHDCRMEFDGQPSEGGDFDDRDPSRRLQRKEARRAGR